MRLQLRPDVVLHRLEGVTDTLGIDAAALANRTATATLPSRHLAERLDQVVGRQAFGQRAGDLNSKIATTDDDRDAVTVGAVQRLICEHEQVFFVRIDPLQHQTDTADIGLFELSAPAGRDPLAKVAGLFLETLDLRLQRRDTGGQFRWRRSQRVAQFTQYAFVGPNLLFGRRASPHLDATNAGADAAVAGYQRDANLTAPFDVGATAEFPSPVAEGNDANLLAVLLVEERHRPGGDRLLERKLLDTADQVGADLLVQ